MSDRDDMWTLAPLTYRQRVLCGLQSLAYWSRAASTYVSVRKVRGAVILMYHSVPPAGVEHWIEPRNRMRPEVFEAQMRFLCRRRRVISMGEMVDALERGDGLEAGTAVLTFDDGYRDVGEVVAPILERYGLPAILYLATGYIGRQESPWADRLYTMFVARSRHKLSAGGDRAARFDLRDATSRHRAFHRLAQEMLVAPYAEREELLCQAEGQLCPTAQSPRLMLTWEEARDLVQRYPFFDIGVHTRDHIDLSTYGGETARAELQQCIGDVERELGRCPKHFSFPYNRFSGETREMVKAFGFRSAVAAGQDNLINGASDRFALPRIETPHSMTLFRLWTGGACCSLASSLMGRV